MSSKTPPLYPPVIPTPEEIAENARYNAWQSSVIVIPPLKEEPPPEPKGRIIEE